MLLVFEYSRNRRLLVDLTNLDFEAFLNWVTPCLPHRVRPLSSPAQCYPSFVVFRLSSVVCRLLPVITVPLFSCIVLNHYKVIDVPVAINYHMTFCTILTDIST